MAILKLGSVDEGKLPQDKFMFLKPYHKGMVAGLQNKKKFRDEANGTWQDFLEVPGGNIKKLQQFLKDAGFYPNSEVTGIFGYGTLAATRLFQEYVRQVEGNEAIGTPDGVVGPKTWEHINRWQRDGVSCEWGNFSSNKPSEAYNFWMGILDKAKGHYQQLLNPVLDEVRKKWKNTDTLPPEAWDFNEGKVHLIGIRRNYQNTAQNRENDDVFILLIKGMAFTFWGSTDPNPKLADRKDEPYLVEGQHKYRFGWHKISNEVQVYKALRPFSNGVLVFRDKTNTNALTENNVGHGLDAPNTTINIHWSGDGDFNFSAGCQVIAGKSYLDHTGKLVDCRGYASESYAGLANGKTRGAYNVLADLVTCYAPKATEEVWYTLGREDNLTEIAGATVMGKLEQNLKQLRFTF